MKTRRSHIATFAQPARLYNWLEQATCVRGTSLSPKSSLEGFDR